MSGFRPAPYNPRKISPEALEGLRVSIEKFGDLSGIVVNRRTGNFVGGHQRLAALGITEIPDPPPEEIGGLRIRVVDWPASKEKAANVAANSPTISGEFTDGLEALLDEMKRDDAALFDALRMQDLAALFPEKPKTEIDPAPIDPPADPVSKSGELYQLGPHRLLCGDSTNGEDVARLVGSERCSLMWTDPPYGINMAPASVARKLPKLRNDALGATEFRAFLSSFLSLARRAVIGEAFVCCDWRRYSEFREEMDGQGFRVSNLIVWNKETRAQNLNRFAFVHEFILYSGPMGPPTIDTNCWTIGREYSAEHLTPKPTELIVRSVRDLKAELIFDPFLGAGSTLIAAAQLGRRCYGMEIEPRYCDVIRKRWGDFAREAGIDPGSDAL